MNSRAMRAAKIVIIKSPIIMYIVSGTGRNVNGFLQLSHNCHITKWLFDFTKVFVLKELNFGPKLIL